MKDDYHFRNMENQGCFRRAGKYGVCDEMNRYMATFVVPELAREDQELRWTTPVSITGTLERLMEIERKKHD